MPYGTIKVDTITFTDGGVDKSVAISGLVQNPTFTGNVTVTGTVSGATIRATTVSGVTISGTTVNAASGVFTTQISGAVVVAPAGTVSAPSVQVGTGASIAPGFYGAGTDQLGVSTGGSSRLIIDSVGQIRVVTLGSAAAPALVVGNDINTGLYSPGADQVAISTNGIGRLFVDASGGIGIGTTSPSYALDVNGKIRGISTNFALIASNGSGTGQTTIGLTREGAATDQKTWELMQGGSGEFLLRTINDAYSSSQNAIAIGRGSSYNVDNISLLTMGSSRLYINSSGGVGIGTTAPSALLHVAGNMNLGAAGTADAEFNIGVGATGNRNAYIDLIGDTTYSDYGLRLLRANGGANGDSFLTHRGTGTLYLKCEDGGSIGFGTNNTERLRITSAGLVGIGTSSPGAALDVQGNIRLSASNPNIEFNNGGAMIYGPSANTLAFATGGGVSSPVEKARIDSSGRLLVGTSSIALGSPQAIIEKTSSDIDLFRVQCGAAESSGNIAGLSFGHGANGARPKTAIGAVATGSFGLSDLVFYVDSVADNNSVSSSDEKMRIDTSGRLLVGTSTYVQGNTYTTGNLLNVSGGPGVGPQLSTYSADAFALGIDFSKSRSASVGTGTIVQSGDALGNILFNGHDGTGYKQAATITAVVDGTPGANDMPGRLVFSTTADGTSTPMERMRITSHGTIRIGQLTTDTPGFGNTTTGIGMEPNNGALFLSRADGSNLLFLNSNLSTGTADAISFRRSDVFVGSVTTTTTSTAYNTSSDYRLKENVTAVTDGIARLQQLKPSRFNFIADPTKTVDGFLAHEVQSVVPEAITGEKDAVNDDGNPVYQGIDQSKLVPLVVAALQEALERINLLEAKVASLEAK